MGLNIKNEEAHKLAQEVAALTGESLSAAVTQALREKLARLHRNGLAERLMEIGKEFSSRMSEETRNFDVDAELYDERGLPK